MDLIPFAITTIALVVLVTLAIAIAKAFSGNNIVGGIVGFAVFLLAILFMGMGAIDTPLINWASEGVSGLIAGSGNVAASSSASPADINIQVDVPPTTVIVGEGSTPEAVTVPLPTEPESVDTAEEISVETSEETVSDAEDTENSIFDLSSIDPDGEFEDGVEYFLYEIQRGDNIYNLSRRFNITQSDLRERNSLRIADPIRLGRDLKIPIN